MEAAQVRTHDGAREAIVAPVPAWTERVWWTPADPAGLGLVGFALTTFSLGMVNTNAISN
jgi:succinate-acetate transporter protein